MKGARPDGTNSRAVGKVSHGLETYVSEESHHVIVDGCRTRYGRVYTCRNYRPACM